MERMTKVDENIQTAQNLLSGIVERCYELEEENKKLKKECEENDYLVEDNARWMKRCEEKIMEIKKLRLEKADLMGERDGLKMVVERLQKEIEELEKQYQHSMGFSDFGGYDE